MTETTLSALKRLIEIAETDYACTDEEANLWADTLHDAVPALKSLLQSLPEAKGRPSYEHGVPPVYPSPRAGESVTITEERASPVTKAEPVAWLMVSDNHRFITENESVAIVDAGLGYSCTALYAHPAPVSKGPGEAPNIEAVLDAVDELMEASVEHTCNREDFRRVLTPFLSAPLPEARGAEEAAYKWGYEYLQHRMESLGRNGWAHDCDGEIEDRILHSPIISTKADMDELIEDILAWTLTDFSMHTPLMKNGLREILRQHMQHSPGWVLVPREPTPGMLEAGSEAGLWLESTGIFLKPCFGYPDEVYKAMLAAAPDSGGEK